MSLNTVYERVLAIMEERPDVRNADRAVMWLYWYKYDGIDEMEITQAQFLFDVTDPATISRACRKVRELYPELAGSQVVERKRMEKEQVNINFWKNKCKTYFKEDK